MHQKWLRNKPEIDQWWTRNEPEMDQNLTCNWSEMDTKGPKTDLKWTKNSPDILSLVEKNTESAKTVWKLNEF